MSVAVAPCWGRAVLGPLWSSIIPLRAAGFWLARVATTTTHSLSIILDDACEIRPLERRPHLLHLQLF
jgi:hypothetical protein